MRLLSQSEADALVSLSYDVINNIKLSGGGTYRFGQALWNNLPLDITKAHWATEHDFFYWKDTDRILETFYEHFVEKE